MAAETGFMIDGVLYEMPALDTFTMDEAQVLYDYSGLTLEDFAPGEDAEPNDQGEYELDDEQRAKLKNPGFMRALMHIAYQRGNPRLSAAKVTGLVGSANLVEALQSLAEKDAEDDAAPLALTKQLDEPSPKSTPDSSEASGNGSTKSSDLRAVPPVATTTTGSGTSSTPSPASSAV